MPLPLPTDNTAWRSEIASALSAVRSELATGEEEPGGEAFWHRMEDLAVSRARVARGLEPLDIDAADLDRTVDAITDITESLRRHGGGDPDDHHINESQFFLLYYVAALVHAKVLDESAAGDVVRGCWDLEQDADDAGGDAEDDEEQDPPWEIRRPPPANPAAWLEEVQGAWREAGRPPPLRSAEGSPVMASGNDLRESAVVLALHRRGAQPPAEAVYGLIGVITEMEDDIARLGPELAELKSSPPLAFVLYYVWTHILIGHADEDQAMLVVQSAAGSLGSFSSGGPAVRSGSTRVRRRN